MAKANKKVLVVEDDRFLVKIYQSKLKREGFEVITAYNGEEGVNMAKVKNPDIILLDLVMPKKDGFTALKEIKEDPKAAKIPVIILSNLGQDSDVERGKKMGAVDYLVKANTSINEVVRMINKYLK
ncbi:response regulator [Patescibacteria group bacterium]|nr:response regulator [Patescibacteria group bacterium]